MSQVAPVDKLRVALALGLAVVLLDENLTLRGARGAGPIVVGTLVLIQG